METIIGIDLGTTGCRVAAFIDDRPVILENSEGERTTPSYVRFVDNSLPLVGDLAKRNAIYNPRSTIYAAKRLIGRQYSDASIRHFQTSLPFSIVAGPDGEAWIEWGGAPTSPRIICALLFQKLADTAARSLSSDVKKVVIAVPAYFGTAQRQAMVSAATSVGLEVLRVVSEPTAAALFYGLHSYTSGRLAIFDWGGGTFDFSIVEMGDGICEVLATDGDTFLGGEDIDTRIQEFILSRLGVRFADLDKGSIQRLKETSEEAKIALSSSPSTEIFIPNLSIKDGYPVSASLVLTRDVLQDLVQDLVDRTLAVCSRALEKGRLLYERYEEPIPVSSLDFVLLVGGSTRLPFVEECVKRFFDKQPVSKIRREDAVALGCAVQAGVLGGSVKDIILLDILPVSFGIESLGGKFESILPKNLSFPTRRSRLVSTAEDNQAVISIRVFEGENEIADQNRFLGSMDFSGFQPGISGIPQIEVTLDIDANGTLKVSAKNVATSYKEEVFLLHSWSMCNVSTLHSGSDLPNINMQGAESIKTSEKQKKLKFLALATEWKSGNGGLSSLNRSLCSALASKGHEVICTVLSASTQEVQAAEQQNVRLIEAAMSPGQSEQASLARRPKLPLNWVPDVVIGHGRVTGPAAAAMVEDCFPAARRMHVVHIAPDEIEWYKLDRGDDAGSRAEVRTRIEQDLGRTAHRVVAVGPKLYDRWATELHPYGCLSPHRLDPGFDSSDKTSLGVPPGSPWRILLVGRAEDDLLKGLDIASLAIGTVVERRAPTLPQLEFIVRGAKVGSSDSLRDKLLMWTNSFRTRVVVKPFETATDQLDGDYRRASLVLMPSRSEGFGLVGLEAIVAGVPVLVSAESGLGVLLAERLTAEERDMIVIPVTGSRSVDAENWSRAIEHQLKNRTSSFSFAEELRARLSQSLTWHDAAARFVSACRSDI